MPHPQRLRQTTIGNSPVSPLPWWPDLKQIASTKPGAVQGGLEKIAEKTGIEAEEFVDYVDSWGFVSDVHHARKIAEVTGIPCEQLRPDIIWIRDGGCVIGFAQSTHDGAIAFQTPAGYMGRKAYIEAVLRKRFQGELEGRVDPLKLSTEPRQRESMEAIGYGVAQYEVAPGQSVEYLLLEAREALKTVMALWGSRCIDADDFEGDAAVRLTGLAYLCLQRGYEKLNEESKAVRKDSIARGAAA